VLVHMYVTQSDLPLFRVALFGQSIFPKMLVQMSENLDVRLYDGIRMDMHASQTNFRYMPRFSFC